MIHQHDRTTNRPFQFTLRSMLMSVAYMSAALGMAMWIARSWSRASPPYLVALILLSVVGVFVVPGLIGASIGELKGNAWRGAQWGLESPFILVWIFAGGLLIVILIAVVVALIFSL